MTMISRPFTLKTIRDYGWFAIGAMLLLLGFVVVMMFAIDSMPMDKSHVWLNLKWVRRLISAMLGADLGDMFTRTGITSLVYTHPMMWTVLISFILSLTSGVLAGEIDRGTMDSLATLPVSRSRYYISMTIATLLYGLPLCWTLWVGVWLGRTLIGWSDVRMDLIAVLTVHLYIVYVFLSCLAVSVSALCNRRTTAVVICFVVVFYSFVLNLIGAFWPAAKEIAFTGFLDYYAPLPIVRDAAWRWGDIGVLLTAGAVFWTLGLIGFSRRDIPAR